MFHRTLLLVMLAGLAATSGPAQAPSEGSATLVLAGPAVAPDTVRKAVAPLIASGTTLLVPPVAATTDPGRGAFLPAEAHDAQLAADLDAAYRLSARRTVRSFLRPDRSRRIRQAIALYRGVPTAFHLMRSGLLRPRRLILLDPDPAALRGVKPKAQDGPPSAARLNIDVFLSQGSPRRQRAQAKAVKAVLQPWTSLVRVFFADLRGQPLEKIVAEMVWPLRGRRMVRVSPSGLQEVDAEELFDALQGVEAVFAGEKHDNTAFHGLQLELLKALDRKQGDLLLSLEMFERDVQPLLDRYLAGEIEESEMLAGSRPWPNYRADYRALVEYARQNGIPVLAANVPRRLASRVAKEGLEVLESLDPEERAWTARDTLAASPAYRKQFADVMKGMEADRLARMYAAQCLKDDTMAESIHDYLEAHSEVRRVLHLNGSFHSSYGLGTVNGLKQRRPEMQMAIVTCIPAPNPRAVDLLGSEAQDDFLVFCAEPLPRPRRSPGRHPTTTGKPAMKKMKMKKPAKKKPKPKATDAAPPAMRPPASTSEKSAGSAAESAE